MTLESQVCSLELSKRLKELGVKQESLFYWNQGIVCDSSFKVIPEACSAFTCGELGELIKKANNVDIHIAFMEVTGGITSRTETVRLMLDIEKLTKMLVYLLENKLITL